MDLPEIQNLDTQEGRVASLVHSLITCIQDLIVLLRGTIGTKRKSIRFKGMGYSVVTTSRGVWGPSAAHRRAGQTFKGVHQIKMNLEGDVELFTTTV